MCACRQGEGEQAIVQVMAHASDGQQKSVCCPISERLPDRDCGRRPVGGSPTAFDGGWGVADGGWGITDGGRRRLGGHREVVALYKRCPVLHEGPSIYTTVRRLHKGGTKWGGPPNRNEGDAFVPGSTWNGGCWCVWTGQPQSGAEAAVRSRSTRRRGVQCVGENKQIACNVGSVGSPQKLVLPTCTWHSQPCSLTQVIADAFLPPSGQQWKTCCCYSPQSSHKQL